MSFRLNPKWVFSVHPHFPSNSPPWLTGPPCSSVKVAEASFNPTRLSFPSTISEEDNISSKDPLKACACASTAPFTLANDYTEVKDLKTNVNTGLYSSSCNLSDVQRSVGEDRIRLATIGAHQSCSIVHYNLLMKNINALEEKFVSSDTLRLEKDIMLHLERLGALELFNTCLTRTLKSSNAFGLSDAGEPLMRGSPSTQTGEVVAYSRKKTERKSRRERALENGIKSSSFALTSRIVGNNLRNPAVYTVKKELNSKRRRLMIARNEAEMSRGVKMVANLERIRTTLEEETGKVASLSRWAEAAGLNEKMLLQNLQFGWYCRDELLKSTRSLVLFLARNYRGLGIAHEDLLQAGYLGVLQGAERFDHTRGYKLSTYVQYWIRKSMSMMVSKHSRGVHVPLSISRAINQIQKARKTLKTSHGIKYPADDEIAKFTGLSLNKIRSASQCLRVVGSIDQKVGDSVSPKYLEFMPDTTIESPEEIVMKQSMKRDIHGLLEGLDPVEKQVMFLRYGLKDYQPRSLGEIGRLLRVSKEWIRRVEKKAMTKLRDQDTRQNLSYYYYLDS